MKRTKLLRCIPCTVPKVKNSDSVIAASQLLEVDGEQAVEISLFVKGELKARYFADKENHSTWVNETWTTCRLENVLRLCVGQPALKNAFYHSAPDMKWAAQEDRDRVYDFLDTYSIDGYETTVNETKRDMTHSRKQERINEMMTEVPCVPEEAEKWVEDKLFPGNILFFKKEENRTTFSCTACGYTGWRKSGWKNGEKTICPKCKAPVTTNSRQKEKTAKAMVTILQQYGKKWVERQFQAVCRWTAGKKDIELFEKIRAIIPLGETWGKVWYGTIQEADEFEQEFWDKPHGKRFVPSYLYPGNLPEVLKAGGLEHCGMDILANAGMKFNVNIYIISFHNHPYLEYLANTLTAQRSASLKVEKVVDFYRNILRNSPDHSISIISIGFFCNLSMALQAMPELFERKVRCIWVMAGCFEESSTYPEYNIREKLNSALQFLQNCRCPLIFVPYEAGCNTMTDLRGAEERIENPIAMAYKIYTEGSMLRPSWDPITVDFAFSGENEYYALSSEGQLVINDQGFTFFHPKTGGNVRYLKYKRSDEEIGHYITTELKAASKL